MRFYYNPPFYFLIIISPRGSQHKPTLVPTWLKNHWWKHYFIEGIIESDMINGVSFISRKCWKQVFRIIEPAFAKNKRELAVIVLTTQDKAWIRSEEITSLVLQCVPRLQTSSFIYFYRSLKCSSLLCTLRRWLLLLRVSIVIPLPE